MFKVKYFLIAAVIMTAAMFYSTVATAALGDSMCSGGQFSLFTENTYCSTPSIFAAAYYLSLTITTGLVIVLVRRRYVRLGK